MDAALARFSDRRPNYVRAQAQMKDLCGNCHSRPLIDRIYQEAEKVVDGTNEKIRESKAIVSKLRQDGLLSAVPFEKPIDFVYFDLWHYDGRTSKHGAFMGGADFIQWHGNYPMLARTVQLRAMADVLRRQHGARTGR